MSAMRADQFLLMMSILVLGGCTLDFDEFGNSPQVEDQGVMQPDMAPDMQLGDMRMVIPDQGPPDMMAADSDGDGVIDGNDNCPDVQNGDQIDLDVHPDLMPPATGFTSGTHPTFAFDTTVLRRQSIRGMDVRAIVGTTLREVAAVRVDDVLLALDARATLAEPRVGDRRPQD